VPNPSGCFQYSQYFPGISVISPSYPGFDRDGGFAECMLTEERMLVQLPSHLLSMDIAPMADAGLTAYNAVRKASRTIDTWPLHPGAWCRGGDRACGTLAEAGITAGRS